VVGLGEAPIDGNQRVFQTFLAGVDIAELTDLVANQLLQGGVVEGGNGGAGVCQQGVDAVMRQIGNVLQLVGRGGREPAGGRKAVDEFEDPAGGDVLGEQGQLGEDQSQELVKLVDQPRALADGRLQATGDLPQGAQLG